MLERGAGRCQTRSADGIAGSGCAALPPVGPAAIVPAMRVLLLCHALPPESVGGVEQHTGGLARALADAGCAVTILARADGRPRPQGEIFPQHDGNPRIDRIAYRWEGVRDFDGIYDVPALEPAFDRWLAERGPFDVAHVHHLTGLSTGMVGTLQARGIPVVLTLHDYWLLCPRGQMFHRTGTACARIERQRCGECIAATFPHWFPRGDGADAATGRLHERARALLQQADRLVVPSARAMPAFTGFGVPEERFTVVENAVDTEALRALPPALADQPALRVGYLGTLLPSKGLHVVVAAVQAVHDRAPGTIQLDVFGNAVPYHGDEGYVTRTFAALRPGDPVRYHGPYRGQDLPGILRGLDLVTAPALWAEAFGLTPREALAAGRPVLVSRIGGLHDAVEDGVQGLVLPPGDVPAWSAALQDLAVDRPRVRAMARVTRGRARGFPAMAQDLLAVYRGVRAGRRQA